MNLRGAPHETVAVEAEITAKVSENFGNWLNVKRVCLLISSYQSGRLLIVGADVNDKVLIQQHKFDRAMGISAYKGGFAFGTLHQIWRFSLINPLDKTSPGGQLVLLAQNCHYTGFVNCHDVARTKNNEILYASTLFNCVAKITPRNNLSPIWVPPFIDGFVPEDRCHLNGLAIEGDQLRFVSMLGASTQKAGWRSDRSKGIIFDLATNKAVASDLWMPHSPRINGDKLYALESGRGSFGEVSNGRISEKLLLPGFTRGLDFHEGIAAIGFSQIRKESIEGLPLHARLKADGSKANCGVVLYDTTVSKVFHSIEFSAGAEEIYDVALLEGTANPRLIHPNSNEMLKTYSVGLNNRRLN